MGLILVCRIWRETCILSFVFHFRFLAWALLFSIGLWHQMGQCRHRGCPFHHLPQCIVLTGLRPKGLLNRSGFQDFLGSLIQQMFAFFQSRQRWRSKPSSFCARGYWRELELPYWLQWYWHLRLPLWYRTQALALIFALESRRRSSWAWPRNQKGQHHPLAVAGLPCSRRDLS